MTSVVGLATPPRARRTRPASAEIGRRGEPSALDATSVGWRRRPRGVRSVPIDAIICWGVVM